MDIKQMNGCLPDNISRIIARQGLKQQIVAKRCGFSPTAFSAMLNGRRLIKACEVPIIAKTLGVLPNDLFGVNKQSQTPRE